MRWEEPLKKAQNSMELTVLNLLEGTTYVVGLISVATDHEAIDLMKRKQDYLEESHHLHKFASNSQTFMKAFPPDDCAVII